MRKQFAILLLQPNLSTHHFQMLLSWIWPYESNWHKQGHAGTLILESVTWQAVCVSTKLCSFPSMYDKAAAFSIWCAIPSCWKPGNYGMRRFHHRTITHCTQRPLHRSVLHAFEHTWSLFICGKSPVAKHGKSRQQDTGEDPTIELWQPHKAGDETGTFLG